MADTMKPQQQQQQNNTASMLKDARSNSTNSLNTPNKQQQQAKSESHDGPQGNQGGGGGGGGQKNKNTPDGGGQLNKHQNQNNSATKKRKMNHNGGGPPDRNDRNERMNGNTGGGGSWTPGPPGLGPPPPFTGHRLTGAPAWDLPPQNSSTQTFTGRCRLFVANLPSSVTEESLRKLFSEFGKLSEVYIGKGNQFSFIKMDTRQNAENAKNALDGKLFEGRTLRVRLAAHAAAIKVTNLPPCVSNELLFLAFSTFGAVERAIVIADDRGRSINEGIVEFVRKSSAQAAIKKCSEQCLLLSSTPMPVVATSLESRDEEEGVPEKNVMHTMEYRGEREFGPRFCEPGTIEFEVAKKWKQLSHIEAQRREAFEAEMRDMHENFKTQMESIKLEESIKQLREQLRHMEGQSQKMNSDREARYDFERQREEQRREHESMLRSQESQLIGPQHNQQDLSTLRRQENELRQQANALQQLLDRQETSLRQINDSGHGHHDNMRMNSNMYGGPQQGMPAGPNQGGPMMGGPSGPSMGGGVGGPPVQQMQGPMNPHNPYGGPPGPNQGGPGGPMQPHPIGPHHPQQMMQPVMQHQPPPQHHQQYNSPYNGGPGVGMGGGGGPPNHTISMPPQSYNTGVGIGPMPQGGGPMGPGGPHPGGGNYQQLPKRNRRY